MFSSDSPIDELSKIPSRVSSNCVCRARLLSMLFLSSAIRELIGPRAGSLFLSNSSSTPSVLVKPPDALMFSSKFVVIFVRRSDKLSSSARSSLSDRLIRSFSPAIRIHRSSSDRINDSLGSPPSASIVRRNSFRSLAISLCRFFASVADQARAFASASATSFSVAVFINGSKSPCDSSSVCCC